MTLLVEDGSGLAGASSYISAADADTYFAAQGNTVWAAFGPVQKEAALVSGCRYLENTYRGKWKGYRVRDHQNLAWPRSNMAPITIAQARARWSYGGATFLTDIDGFPIQPTEVPRRVKDAQCEAALLYATGFDFTKSTNAVIKGTSKTVDRVSYSKDYAGAVSERNPKLVGIDQLLLGLILSAPGATFGNVIIQRG